MRHSRKRSAARLCNGMYADTDMRTHAGNIAVTSALCGASIGRPHHDHAFIFLLYVNFPHRPAQLAPGTAYLLEDLPHTSDIAFDRLWQHPSATLAVHATEQSPHQCPGTIATACTKRHGCPRTPWSITITARGCGVQPPAPSNTLGGARRRPHGASLRRCRCRPFPRSIHDL